MSVKSYGINDVNIMEQRAGEVGKNLGNNPMDKQSQRIIEIASSAILLVVAYLSSAPILLFCGVVSSATMLYHAWKITEFDNEEERSFAIEKIKTLSLQQFQNLYPLIVAIGKDVFEINDESLSVKATVVEMLQECWSDKEKREHYAHTNVIKLVETFVGEAREACKEKVKPEEEIEKSESIPSAEKVTSPVDVEESKPVQEEEEVGGNNTVAELEELDEEGEVEESDEEGDAAIVPDNQNHALTNIKSLVYKYRKSLVSGAIGLALMLGYQVFDKIYKSEMID